MGAGGFIGLHVGEQAVFNKVSLDLYSRKGGHTFLRGIFPSTDIFCSESSDFFDRAQDYSGVIYLSSTLGSTSQQTVSGAIADSFRETAFFFEKLSSRNPHCHVVFASSGGTVYGPGHSHPIPETMAVCPTTSYAFGKVLTEETLRFLSTVHGLPVTVLRIANPVGYWQLRGRHGFISAAIRCGLSDEVLTVFGDGSNARDYFDVDDLAALMLKIGTTSSCRTFQITNVGSGLGRSETDVIRAVENALNTKINIRFSSARKSDLKYAVLDTSLAERTHGWRSCKSLDEIITKVWKRVQVSGLPQRS